MIQGSLIFHIILLLLDYCMRVYTQPEITKSSQNINLKIQMYQTLPLVIGCGIVRSRETTPLPLQPQICVLLQKPAYTLPTSPGDLSAPDHRQIPVAYHSPPFFLSVPQYPNLDQTTGRDRRSGRMGWPGG